MNVAVTEAPKNYEEIVTKLVDMLRTATKKPGEEWSAETTLTEAGIDSFEVVEYIFEIEDAFGVEINFNANKVEDRPQTIGDFARLIMSSKASTK